MTAAARLHVIAGDWLAPRVGLWNAPSFIARCAFFVLGVVAGGLTAAVFEFIYRPAAELAAGVTLLAAAEWLILRKHLFHAGFEEALWTGGLLAISLHFATGNLGWSVAVALAFALAGIRLLNPFLLTLAFVAGSVAIDFAGGHQLAGEPKVAIPAGIFCYAVGGIALFLGSMQFRRPSHDKMLGWLAVIMPLCGFVWLATQHRTGIRVGTGVASAVFAATALMAGLRRRAHGPLLACMVAMGCVAYQLRVLTDLPLELKLLLWGSAALILALGLDRYLRRPRGGITSLQVSESTGALDLLQLAGASALSPSADAQTVSPLKGAGGNFSGGGAGGSY